MLQTFAHKVNESGAIIIMFLLACFASILKAEEYSFKAVLSGVIFAGFVAYTVNLWLINVDLSENSRTVIVGCCAYLNRYLLDLLNKFGADIVNNPKQAFESLLSLWKK